MRGKTLALALVVSTGLHFVAVLVLDKPVPGQGPAFPFGFHVQLTQGAAPATAPPRSATEGPAAPERYYRRSELDDPAVALAQAPLLIPEYAYHSRLAGKVRARVFIGADGAVDRVVILEVEPVRGLFERPAVEALRGLRYQPARIGGRPVRSQKVVDVVFDPRADHPAAGK
ncbi:MAG TPA: energy transducer TonB [Methylomirabilota bacterium]|nr:energy transducer TonB [Methylomirabilota bacterium]